jgi:uncharacterized protein
VFGSRITGLSIPVGGYKLIQMSATGANGSPLPTPDLVASPAVSMSSTGAKLVLVNHQTAITSCADAGVKDLVGWNTGASCYEGAGPAPATSNTMGDIRTNACADTNDNAADFSSASPTPRCGATAPAPCGC